MGYAQELSSGVWLDNARLTLACGCPSSCNVSIGRKTWACPSHSRPQPVGLLGAASLPKWPLGPA